MTKAQQIYERVEALVGEGTTKADAFRRVADELSQPVNSVRGAYYQHSRRGEGGSGKRRTRETTPASAVENAKAVLERAIIAIDEEIDIAKTRADEAKAEYDALKASATERKEALKAKITALEA